MTKAKHKQRHKLLHKYLDELVADWIDHNKDKMLSKTTIMELLGWSAKQTLNPQSLKENEK